MLKEAVQELPDAAGIGMANRNWRVVREFVTLWFGISLSRSSCLNYLHRLGFAFKRPKKRLLKADEAKRESFVAEYAALMEEACQSNAKIFFSDEAHFRADAELRGKLSRGEQTSPRYGEKASYYSVVCLETGEVEWKELEGNSNSERQPPWSSCVRGTPGVERDLGQRAGPPWRSGEGVYPDARSEPAAGEPARLQPGFQRR